MKQDLMADATSQGSVTLRVWRGKPRVTERSEISSGTKPLMWA